MEPLHSVKNNCLKAQELGIKAQHSHKIGITNLLKLKYHLIFCCICRIFLKKSRHIDRLLQEDIKKAGLPNMYTLSEPEKQKMQQQIDKIS